MQKQRRSLLTWPFASRYNELRSKYHAEYLPSVYQKVRVDLSKATSPPVGLSAWVRAQFWNTWPFSGLYGVAKTLLGKDYLLDK